MPAPASASLTKLKIDQCELTGEKMNLVQVAGGPFVAMINPSSYKHGRAVQYTANKVQGAAASGGKYSKTLLETLSFPELILDGTGVLEAGQQNSVRDKIDLLVKIAYTYVGNEHERPYVRVLWGELLFYGRLKALDIDYTLFTPGGMPLRAKTQLSFEGWMSSKEESLQANRSSPDLTHVIEVKAGDSLPLLCERVYRNAAYYMAVARANGLTNVRDLRPGMRLVFPPLD